MYPNNAGTKIPLEEDSIGWSNTDTDTNPFGPLSTAISASQHLFKAAHIAAILYLKGLLIIRYSRNSSKNTTCLQYIWQGWKISPQW